MPRGLGARRGEGRDEGAHHADEIRVVGGDERWIDAPNRAPEPEGDERGEEGREGERGRGDRGKGEREAEPPVGAGEREEREGRLNPERR